ncbi:ATP-dependent transcriptional regulator, MalT-like, LuxR family protein [Cupriavidus sp. HMR-1]|uniref:LuxR C-terminal-related transcriptional regulator n=1 Tax=Cupriavidus sp. HMR-1 TaxID=1249621 RepID=UPI0002A39383|nr:LuxR C-terminal-related transcriptional regulator [Cupriavidus sp. HMR-1]EKZ95375.1 ATP-dependent transcriptional regulator, MalT-like, LuxR family protein [Cupriavidus sp. HMR-1]
MNSDNLLVATKFSPPRISPRHIPREHLLARLRDTKDCTVTLLTGGAGFGKTILLAQWRQELMRAGIDVAWLSLSHDDRQFSSFCTYLMTAFQRLGMRADYVVPDAAGSEQSMEALVAVATSALEEVERELYLLIDDYQYAEAPAAHRLMQKLLDHCPANLHFVIASRTMPPLSLGRLRMQGQVSEIDFADLPFGLDETRVFFDQSLSTLKLTADEVRLIHDLTNGWPACLQPVATMLRIRPGKRTNLRSLLWKSADLQSYLAEDVVAYLPPALTAFMEKLSVFRRFNAGLAEAVTENPDAADLIKRAEDENLLIYRVETDDPSPWYRFHPLFGEFLAQRLAQQGKEAVEAVHRRASCWFAAQDLLVEAVRHASLGGDLDFAADAMEQAATRSTWSMSYIGPLLYMIDRLPQETLFSHPRLFFLGCMAHAFTGRADKAERWLEQIRRTEAAKIPAISSKFPIIDSSVAVERDDLQRVIEVLEPLCNAPMENASLRYACLVGLAVAYLAVGRLDDTRELFDANPIAPEDRDNDMAMVFESRRAQTCLFAGDVREAERLGASTLARAEARYGRASLPANLCADTLAFASYELDHIDDAREALANRAGMMQSSWPDVMTQSSICRARLDFLQDAPETALAFLEAQAAHFHLLGLDRALAYMLAEQIRILLTTGEQRRARELATRLEGLRHTHENGTGAFVQIPAIAALVRARLALADSNPRDALAALAEVRRFGEKYGRGQTLVVADLLAAVAHDGLQQHDQTTRCLTDAVTLAAKLGLVRTLLDTKEQTAGLLAGLQDADSLPEPEARYLADILARMTPGAARPEPAPVSAVASAATRIAPDAERGPLTPRELEILTLIAEAMSNKRIALTLNITFGTVKWNVKNILAKLGVSSRYDAIALARQRGLLK